MEGVEPVMAKDGVEETGERGNQPGKDAMCSDQTSNSLISVLQCHPWIGNADTHSI